MAWLNFEHKLHQFWRSQREIDGPVFLAVSGGADSWALLLAMHSIRSVLPFSISVVHVHHGKGNGVYRYKAWRKVRGFCERNKIPFFSNYKGWTGDNFMPKMKLNSEEEFRYFRGECYEKMLPENYKIVTGHHQADLLETRLMRLVRGTGQKGLRAMTAVNDAGNIIRPLLQFSKSEIQEFLLEKGEEGLQDPSNNKEDYFRNWVRNNWLAQLEEHKPGSVDRLAQSLETLANIEPPTDLRIGKNDSISLSHFLRLSEKEKSQCLAVYMHHKKLKNYTQNHINEVLKRLDKPNNGQNFRLLRCNWIVNETEIRAIPEKTTPLSPSDMA